jgi:hypothetical protein
MGGQACVFYGAAQFSKDVDFALLADEENYQRLQAALAELQATRIAVPRFDPAVLERGHAVHFRCQAPGVQGLRVDIMTKLRDLAPFSELWARRTTLTDESGSYNLLAVQDLVLAKKTQREKDWPVIAALVEGHYYALRKEPTAARIEFWLKEARTPERLAELALRFPAETHALSASRPLLVHAISGNMDAMRSLLDAEVRAEQARDRVYWEPLRRELETFRREERINE